MDRSHREFDTGFRIRSRGFGFPPFRRLIDSASGNNHRGFRTEIKSGDVDVEHLDHIPFNTIRVECDTKWETSMAPDKVKSSVG